MSKDFLQAFGVVVGALVGLPLLVATVKITQAITSIMNLATSTALDLTKFVTKVERLLESHDDRIREAEGKVSVLWDGHERRKNTSDEDTHNA